MKGSRATCFLLIATVVCSLSVVLVLRYIESTRLVLSKSNPGSINYVLQTYRNIDSLQDSLGQLLLEQDPAAQASTWSAIQTRFDIVWAGVFQIESVMSPGKEAVLDSKEILLSNINTFLQSREAAMSLLTAPERPIVESMLDETRQLTSLAYALGIEYFSHVADARDELNAKLDKFYRYLWVSSLLLLLTASLLIAQLLRLNNVSRKMFKDARHSEEQLAQVVEELRSGRMEQKAKDSFLAAASHDLRQPLHALGLFVNALENKVPGTEGRVILDKIKQSTEALNSLFNSLLDISRLDAGVVEVSVRHFKIGEILDNLKEEFAPMAEQKNLSLQLQGSDKAVYTDEILLNRVLRNLIDNAIVHSTGGCVQVSCLPKGPNLQITVTDEGPGIPLDEQTHVFLEYYQLDNPERDRSKGLGLGLSIVKRLCQLLNIELTMDSTPGKGTTFELLVPAGQLESIESVQIVDSQTSSHYDFSGQLVLVIDDERDVLQGMEMILDETNCQTMAVDSELAARDLIVERNLTPSIIIADYRLREGRTGLQAVESIREELNDDLPAIIVTGDTSPERVREVAESGMLLMHKPVIPARLFHALNQMLFEAQAPEADSI